MKISKNKIKTKEEVSLDDLKEVKNILDKYNIEFWLDCGVLLGAFRDCRFIPWDCDTDLGIWKKDISKILPACRELQRKDFKIQLGRNGISIKRNISFIPISILFYRLSNNKAIKEWGSYKASQPFQYLLNIFFWTFLTPYYAGINLGAVSGIKNFARLSLANIGYLVPRFIKKWASGIESKYGQKYISIIPGRHFVNLSTIKFYDLEFKVPSETEGYLSYRYGKDWRFPRRDWVGASEDGTIFKNDGKIFNKNL